MFCLTQSCKWVLINVALFALTVTSSWGVWGQIVEPAVARHKLQLQQVELALEEAESEAMRHRQELDNLQAELVKNRSLIEESMGRQRESSVSPASYDEIVRMLQSQRVSLIVELAGIEARHEAWLELLRQPGQDRTEEKFIVDRLEEMVQSAKENVREVTALFDSSVGSKVDLNNARRELMELEIRLAETRRKALQTWTVDEQLALRNIALDRSEKSARLAAVEKLLKEIAPLYEDVQNTELLRRIDIHLLQKMETIRQALNEIETKRLYLKRSYQMLSEAIKNDHVVD